MFADLIDFRNGDTFDGITSGETSAIPGNLITTHAINGVTTAGTHALNTNGGKLGVDSGADGGGESARWDPGESWTFSFRDPTVFSGIDFGGFGADEFFHVRASDFIGLGISATPSAGVTYTSGTGLFTFDGSVSNDSFDVNDIGGSGLAVASNSQLTISYSGDKFANLQGMNFATVPEPNGAGVLAIVLAASQMCRRRIRTV